MEKGIAELQELLLVDFEFGVIFIAVVQSLR